MKRGAGDTVLCHCSSEQRGHIWREREGRLGHKGQLGIGNWPCKARLPLEETGTRESCEQSRAGHYQMKEALCSGLVTGMALSFGGSDDSSPRRKDI